MRKSFLRVQDWAPEINLIENPYWNDLLLIIDEFQHLVDTEKKQLNQCLKQQSQKRYSLIKNFHYYKRSLKYQGQIMMNNAAFFDTEKAKVFFSGYYDLIEEIVIKITKDPAQLTKLLSSYKEYKKFNAFDFSQNIIMTIYPSYLPNLHQQITTCRYLQFAKQVIETWDYCIEQGRPLTYTIIDQLITGFLKTPEIICYVEKISIAFMKEINKCKMDFFAFDQQAIRNQLQVKKSMALSLKSQTQPKSRWQKFTSYFKKKDEEDLSFYSQTSEIMDHNEIQINTTDIMRRRQKDFITCVKKTIQVIMNEQPPFFLKKLLSFFHGKIVKLYNKKNTKIQYQQQKNYYRHYCYFLMTNLIFQEIHGKFTIAHEDTGMTPADLQNITEIIRIMSNIFQGVLPEGQKYKNESIISDLKYFIPKIPDFYEKTFGLSLVFPISFVNSVLVNIEEVKQQQQPELSLRQLLLNQHQNTLILSFNDIKILIDVLNENKTTNLVKGFGLSPEALSMKFLKDQQTKKLFDSTKKIDFSNKKYESQNILFVFNSKKPTVEDIHKFYLGNESPLKNLSAFTNSLIYESNLTVSQALQLTRSINTIKSIPLKEMKILMVKLAHRYKNLYVNKNEKILQIFRNQIKSTLQRYLTQKSNMLIWRQELLNKMGSEERIINFYCNQLQSSQFYERISEAFIHNIKIKVILNIENDQFRVNSNINNLKGIQLQGILMNDKSKMKEKDDYILRHSFQTFHSIKDLLKTLTNNTITKTALTRGRRVDEFNQVFTKICDIIVSYIQDFINKRQILQNLSKQTLAKIIIGKIQDHIFDKCKNDNALDEDIQLMEAKTKINIKGFFQKDLEELPVDWEFLVDECIRKFKIIMGQISVHEKLKHFEELLRMIFTIIGFTMPKNKISAQIITPIMQYLILRCPNIKHYECLYCLQCLKWTSSPQTSYNITLYYSSLHYISKIMKQDYPL